MRIMQNNQQINPVEWLVAIASFFHKNKYISYTIGLILLTVTLVIPSVFASTSVDTFSGSSSEALLENHTSDSGHTWSINGATPSASMVISDASRIRSTVSGDSIYMNSWTPGSADYDVSTDIYAASTSANQQGVGGRAGSGAFTGYYALVSSGPKITLYRAGNGTPLGEYPIPGGLTAGQTYNLKLSMAGNNIKVFWDSAKVIDVTATGANIISSAGRASVYSKGNNSNTSGLHLDNFIAIDNSVASLTAGTLSLGSKNNNSAIVSWTSAVGGTAPITAQLQRSPQGDNNWSNVSDATTSPATDTGLSPATAYDYRVAYTDATPDTVYSNVLTVTTDVGPTETYTVQATDLWDNGYNNVQTPRQSTFSRLIFETDAPSIVVNGSTSIYGSYPSYAHLGVKINGVNQPALPFMANGNQSFTVNLGQAGVTRTVEIITGLQSRPTSILGSYIDSVTYPDSASFDISNPTIGDRVLVYGDSISVGGNATEPAYNSYVSLLRDSYDFRVMLEGWGYRSLHEDANTALLRAALVGRMASYQPKTIYLAIGTNDYGLNQWSSSSFGTAYAAMLDDLHTALPDTRIICQTPLVRSSEGANGSGSTLASYRSQIASACSNRSYATLIDGSTFLTTADLADGVHPTTAGFAKYAKRIAPILMDPGFTVDGPASGTIGQVSGSFNVDISKANFMGDQSITITAPDGVINATAAGGIISANGTDEVTVTPANNATNFSFTYTSASSGSKQLEFSNAQNWKNPDNISYNVGAVVPSAPTSLSATRGNAQVGRLEEMFE